jgi:hypothetical protein
VHESRPNEITCFISRSLSVSECGLSVCMCSQIAWIANCVCYECSKCTFDILIPRHRSSSGNMHDIVTLYNCGAMRCGVWYQLMARVWCGAL